MRRILGDGEERKQASKREELVASCYGEGNKWRNWIPREEENGRHFDDVRPSHQILTGNWSATLNWLVHDIIRK